MPSRAKSCGASCATCGPQQRFNVILVTHDLRESVFLADTVYVMSKQPGRFMVKKQIELPRPRDLEITYTDGFTDVVHELRGHIGAIRKQAAAAMMNSRQRHEPAARSNAGRPGSCWWR